ncbi:MAG: uracil-DNA glycosylase [Cryobacterium sp.]|nr:uracil-DNA glycosylase [Cryobacterium sp.]
MKDTDSEVLLLLGDTDPEEAEGLRAYALAKSRERAFAKATTYLAENDSDMAVDEGTARWNPSQRLWILPERSPEHSLALLAQWRETGDLPVGGGCIVVPDDGEVYSIGSVMTEEWDGVPSAAEEAGLRASWAEVLDDEVRGPYWQDLMEFVAAERAVAAGNPDDGVYPTGADVFNAFDLADLKDVKVLILGQDPYFSPGLATGLAFSIPATVPRKEWPHSLRVIINEMTRDLGLDAPPTSGDLTAWAEEGVLLLNTVLTVRHEDANSHANYGWEKFTDAAISAVSLNHDRAVFMLWGVDAQEKRHLIDENKHKVIVRAHPRASRAKEPLISGSKPFTEANTFLDQEPNPRGRVSWEKCLHSSNRTRCQA